MSTVKFDTVSIDLPDGWRALVLAGYERLPTRSLPPPKLPGADQWEAWLGRLVSDPCALPGYAALKYSREGEVIRAHVGDDEMPLEVVCKRSRAIGLRRRLAALFQSSREQRNHARAWTLIDAGINTAVPLALVERRSMPRQAWLVTEFIPDLIDLDQVVLQVLPRMKRTDACRAKHAILTAIVELLARMAHEGIDHRDLKASNILLGNWNNGAGPSAVWMVDLDGIRKRRTLGTEMQFRSIVRLAASLLGYSSLTRGDYARFLKAYLSRSGQPSEAWRQHFRDLAARANEYVRQSRRRKTHKLDGYDGEVS